jgi:hypothetical protein
MGTFHVIRRGTLPARLAACAFFTAMALMVTDANVAHAQVSQTQVRQATERAAVAAASDMQLGVDPRIIEQMVASAQVFAGNFCYAPAGGPPDRKCSQSLMNDSVAQRQARDFLQDAASGADSITTFGARLAQAIGNQFAQIGWPSEVKNTAGVVAVARGQELADRVRIYSPTGYVEVGRSVSKVLLDSGQHTLVVEYSSTAPVTTSISLGPRQQVALASSNSSGRTVGRLEPPAQMFCYDKAFGLQGARDRRALAAFNWGRAMTDGGSAGHLASIATKYAVDIKVDDRTRQCGARCRDALAVAFSQAVAVWRTGCQRCNANALALLRVGDSVWIDSRLAGRLRQLSGGRSVSLDLASRIPDEGGRTVAAPSLGVPLSTVVGYEPLSSDSTLRQELCQRSNAGAPWIASGKYFVCQGAFDFSVVSPTVSLLDGPTSCGPASDFVACGLPNMGIELTLRDTAFKLLSADGELQIGRALQGDASIAISDVVLHEVGHWFGVPHFEDVGLGRPLDVMASTLGDGETCVSASSLMMMNNAMDSRWEWRVEQRNGLRRPRATVRDWTRAEPTPANSR